MSTAVEQPLESDAVPQVDHARDAARFAVSAALSALVGVLWWAHIPDHLSGHINIVGYPSFQNYNYLKAFTAYRLAVWEFPLVTVIFYALLRWRGPLRHRGPGVTRLVERLDLIAHDEATAREAHPLVRIVRLLPPAAVVVLAASMRPASATARIGRVGVAAGLVYVAGVLLVSFLLGVLISQGRLPRWVPEGGDSLSLVNGFGGAVVSVGALFYASKHTMVISSTGTSHAWPWFPGWLAALMLLAVLAWMIWRLVRGWSPSRVERRIRTVLVGSVAIFLLTAVLPGGLGSFQGFDDSQSAAGADLLSRGYFPWRDFLFIHGLFEDALRSSLGFGVFQHSLWGANAGALMIVYPLCWVGYYLLAAWAGRRGSLMALGVFALAAWGGIAVGVVVSMRFVLLSVVFVLLGEAIRRPAARWTVLLTFVLFVEAVLVPEASFQVLAVAFAIAASDLIHRRPDETWWTALRRTRYFIGAGAALCVVWAIYLAFNHALGPFVNYYRIFGPGHAASGALPRGSDVTHQDYAMFLGALGLVALTILTVAWRFFERRAWTAQDWVTVATAIMSGLYGEKAIGRFDGAHVQQAIAVTVPLWIMWTAKVLGFAERYLIVHARRVRVLRPTVRLVRQPIALTGLIVLVLTVPAISQTVRHAPSRVKAVVPSLTVTQSLVGYSSPNAVDPKLLGDLNTVLDTYVGRDGTIFDNTNSLGYFYYLLQGAPASSFIHVSMAEPEFSQKMVIDQLRKTRPALVAFDETKFGLPEWDGPRNNVRHFEIGQYLLDGWTPVLRSHTVLFLLRNDLVSTMPSIPTLSTPPQTSGLYFSSPTCAWGDTANFLESRPSGASVSLPVMPQGTVQTVSVRGWAVDAATGLPPATVAVTVGGSVVAVLPVDLIRPDVATALSNPAYETSGFDATFTTADVGDLGAYVVSADGTLHPVGNSPIPPARSLTLPDGRRMSVSGAGAGNIDSASATTAQLMSISVPPSVNLSSFPLATFSANGEIGNAHLVLTDQSPLPSDAGVVNGYHDISATSLPLTGSSMSVRVGSCLQWHGYSGTTLYLLQDAGRPVTQLRLSGVRD